MQNRRLTKRLFHNVNLTIYLSRFQVKLERREIKLPKPNIGYHTAINENARICYRIVN